MGYRITIMVAGVEMEWVGVRSKEELKPGDRIRYSTQELEFGVYGGIGSHHDWTVDDTDNPRIIGDDGESTGSSLWPLSALLTDKDWHVQVLRPVSAAACCTEEDVKELKDTLSETVFCLRQYIGYTNGRLDGQAELERAERLLERLSSEKAEGGNG